MALDKKINYFTDKLGTTFRLNTWIHFASPFEIMNKALYRLPIQIVRKGLIKPKNTFRVDTT